MHVVPSTLEFEQILEQGTGVNIGSGLDEVIRSDTLKRQLSVMVYGVEIGEVVSDVEKLKHVPLTNLGCKTYFAKLNDRFRVSDIMTCVSTYSKNNIVTTNGILVDSKFLNRTKIKKLN